MEPAAQLDHETRRKTINATDVPSIFDCDDFGRDQHSLWVYKHYGAVEERVDHRQLWGTFMEPGLIAGFNYLTGKHAVHNRQTFVHAEHAWMGATPDALDTGERIGVDAKMVFFNQRFKWGTTANDIPWRVQLQCAWYMAFFDFNCWYVVVWMGENFHIYELHRDLLMEKGILSKCYQWWERYVVGNEEPPIGGSPASHKWLQKHFPSHARPDLREPTADEQILLNEYVAMRVEFKQIEKKRELMENQLQRAIGDREGLEWPDGRLTWRKTKDKNKVQWEAIARGFMTRHMPDVDEQKLHIDIHTNKFPGERRMLLKSDAVRDAAEEAA